MSRRSPVFRIPGLLAGLVVVGCAVLTLSACTSGEDSGQSSSASPVSTVPGQNGADEGGDVDFDAAIGDCVTLSGTMMDAEIDHAQCGSENSNYKVVAKAPTQDGCASDVDQTYYVTLGGREQGALCLDIDWVEGQCMTIPSGSDSPTHSPCTPGKPDTVHVLKILTGTTDESGCPAEATSYYTYDERQLVTCVAEV
ncbi:LppU family putative lipoprotein [Nocardia testacea]|uniref:LppU family putative lipoprotein n=1 Tax=Nocardia testacea TaxID=248551 RepID=UPI0033F010E9